MGSEPNAEPRTGLKTRRVGRPQQYLRASDYNLAAQRHNHRVFLDRLSAGQAAVIAAAFVALGSAAGSVVPGAMRWALVSLCVGVCLYFSWVALGKRRSRR